LGKRSLIALICTSALLGSTALPQAGFVQIPGDVNGDRRVDVLDIQAVIGGMLASGERNRLTDLNRDGQTDVLDLQLVLSWAQQPAEERERPPEGLPRDAGRYLCQDLSPAKLERRATALAVPEPPQRKRGALFAAGPSVASSRTERYLFQLTPHAPPFRV